MIRGLIRGLSSTRAASVRLAVLAATVAAAVSAGAATAAPPLPIVYDAPDPGGSEAAPARVPPPQRLFGFNEDIAGGAHGQSPVTYSGLARLAGATTIRTFIDWRRAEPQRDVWDEGWFNKWSYAYDSASRAGLRPILAIGMAPTWARDPENQACDGPLTYCRFPPSRGMYDEWQEFVQEMVLRFPHAVLQIWNEPNQNANWGGAPHPERYAELLDVAYDTVKAINPAVPVLSAGIANNQEGNGAMPMRTFLERAFAAPRPMAQNMDALALNMFPHSDQYGAGSLLAKSFKDVRETQAAAGDETPIFITETGLAGGTGFPQSERQQATGLLRLYKRLTTMPDVIGVVFHRLIEPRDSNPNPVEQGYAWLRFDTAPLEPKPVYCAFAERAGNLYPPCLSVKIVAGPRGRVRSTRKRFQFVTTSPEAGFECSLDERPFRRCRTGRRYKRLAAGPHRFLVRARDRNGQTGNTVQRKFRVARPGPRN